MNTEVLAVRRRVLVVDDDAGIRLLISATLKKQGYEVVVASGVLDAQKVFITPSPSRRRFDAVVSDYMMPDGTGLELLEWIKLQDAALAAIFVTAVGERDLVKKSLRTGACDFLDKPVQLPLLVRSVEQAVERTARQRELRDAESSVQEVGRLQELLLGTNPASLPGVLDICWHPKHAAGGDLVNVFKLGDDRLLVVVADVSGHDLKAGFISAFFQGVVRGMIDNGLPVQQVFSYFNRFLLHEWSGSQNSQGGGGEVLASVSVCGFDIDLGAKRLSVLNAGFPLPYFTDGADGTTLRCGRTASHPLGWFDEDPTTLFEHGFEAGGYAYAWTDGLEDLAGTMNVSPLSLAECLLEARRNGVVPPFLKDCADDVLLVRLNLKPKPGAMAGWIPLIQEQYFLPSGRQIDALQAFWENCLKLAVPGMPEATMFDILLCSREAVINGIKYGCGVRPEQPCMFEVVLEPATRVLRVVVEDPGPGHEFDWARHAKAAEELMLDEHRGLILMNRISDRMSIGRRGARIMMEFELNPATRRACAA